MELIDKLKDYIKVLEKAQEMYAKNLCNAIWVGKSVCLKDCIRDLKRMIDETELE